MKGGNMEKYQTNRKCKNCEAINWFLIEKSKTVEEYLKENQIKCSSCNCPLYKEKEEKEEE